jgi:hypothetical protein
MRIEHIHLVAVKVGGVQEFACAVQTPTAAVYKGLAIANNGIKFCTSVCMIRSSSDEMHADERACRDE